MKSFTFLSVFIYFLILFTNNSEAQMTWNHACSFGSSSYIAVPHSSSLNITGSFTIEMWIKPENSTTQTLLEKRSGSTGFAVILSLGRFAIRTNSITRLRSRNALPLNQWTHVAGTYSSLNDQFVIYINGVSDTLTTVVSAAPLPNTDSVKIGNGSNGIFTGELDEIRIGNAFFGLADYVNQNMRISLATNSGFHSYYVLLLTFQSSRPTGTVFSLNDWTSNNNDAFNRGATEFPTPNIPLNTISVNECLHLSGGALSYLAGPDHPSVSPTSGITVETWIYPIAFNPGLNTIVHKGNSSGSVTDYRMSVDENTFRFYVNDNSIYSTGVQIPIGKWTHLAFTYSGASGFMKFIHNGEIIEDATNFVGNIHNNNDSIYVGGTPNLQRFDGFIDELRITSADLPFGIIGNRVFTSVNESNDTLATNVAYNFDGSLHSNSDAGPQLFFRGATAFSWNAYYSSSPVSPLSHSTELNFQKGFYINNPYLRIPSSGSSGFMVSDTLDIPISELISDVNVFVGIKHTDEDNLILSLISPSGASMTLYNSFALLNSSDNIVTIFDDQADSTVLNNTYVMYTPRIQPFSSLSAFNGTNTLGKWKLQIQDVVSNDTGRLIGWGIQFNNQSKKKPVLSLTALIQGFYNPVTNFMVPDTMRAYIRNVSSPFNIYDSSKALVNSSGKANFVFNNVPDGEPVFIQVKHRNSIETWSMYSGFLFTIRGEEYFDPFTSTLKYDFTKTFFSAWGSNVIKVDSLPDTYAIYSGDVNQDGSVNLIDILAVFNDAGLFATGYIKTDLTGDNSANLTDILLAHNNFAKFVNKIVP